MLHETLFSLPDVALNLASASEVGPPLLVLHGVSRSWQDMLPIMPGLALRWQLHGLDFRGHGRSARAASYFVADHVRDVGNLLTTAFAEPVVVFGHSLGALVALSVAGQFPERVRAVILEDPPAPKFVHDIQRSGYFDLFTAMKDLAGSTQSVADITRLLAEIRMPSPEGRPPLRLGDVRDPTSLRFSARCLQNLDPEVFTPLLQGRWLEGLDIAALAARVACPALLLRGNENLGGMLPREEADLLAGAMADCTLINLPQVGHLIHQLETGTTVRLVTGFLESLR